MKNDSDSLDLFCRVNIQSEFSHKEFVSFIACSVGGVNRMNLVTTDRLDISVDDNDEFDAEKARTGRDRWLFFRYSLEVDPIEGVSLSDYVAAIGNLLKSLWSSDMDAVAACEFEDRLPRNVRRLKWGGAESAQDATPSSGDQSRPIPRNVRHGLPNASGIEHSFGKPVTLEALTRRLKANGSSPKPQ